ARPGPTLYLPLAGPPSALSSWDADVFAAHAVHRGTSYAFDALRPRARRRTLAVGDLALVPAGAGALLEPDALAATLLVTWTQLSDRELLHRAMVSDCARRLPD